jgi:hypothetical protein
MYSNNYYNIHYTIQCSAPLHIRKAHKQTKYQPSAAAGISEVADGAKNMV